MKKVGRYVIVSELGRGAMGVVYRASDPTIDRDVALKVLSLSQGQEEGTNSPQEMFMREVRAAGRLAHPSIVTIYDAFDDPVTQSSCIVMELVPGVTLEKILESGKPPTTDQTLGLIRQVAEALDYAHRNKVIHRDLKPANILVTEDGRAKITDFGIAKVLAREGVARTIGIMGTPSYMSPEQVRGGDIDARTDVFSLGIMIFTMLTGQKPFTGNTAAVMFKIVYEDPASPSTVNTKLSPEHDYVVRKCLAKDRNERYATVRDLLNDLDDIQSGHPPRSQSLEPFSSPAVSEAAPVTAPEARTLADASGIPSAASVESHVPATTLPPTPAHAEPYAPPPVSKAPPDPTVAMPRSEPAKPLPPTPPSAPLGGTTVLMQVPDLASVSGVPSPAHPARSDNASSAPKGAPLMGQTLPMRVPDLSAVSSAQPPSTIPPSTAHGAPLEGKTAPMQVPDLSDVSVAPPTTPPKPIALPQPPVKSTVPVAKPAPPPIAPPIKKPAAKEPVRPVPVPPPPVAPMRFEMPSPTANSESAIRFGDESNPEAAPSKSKGMPLILAAVAVLVIAAVGGLAYWKFHKSAATQPGQEVVVASPAVPPPLQPSPAPQTTEPPVVNPAPAPPPAANPAPTPAKKVPPRKPKQPAIAQPQPQPAPQPAPVVAPAPTPAPVTPSPADIAKAEAAKLLNSPRIINVVCNFSLKEIYVAFTGGGKSLYEGTEKGKKKKGGFLGLKGSYEGSFTHTLTVPAGVSTVGIKVQSKDGSLDITNTVKMPTVGGFVPTLVVVVDDGQVTLTWKGGAGGI